MLSAYYRVTKPGIVYGNALYAAAGFLLAAKGHIHWLLFIEMLFGLSLVVAAACVLNNYLDRDLDSKMARTRRRPLVSGAISGPAAIAYGSLLLIAGVLLLALTNGLALLVAVGGFVVYVFIYDWAKRHSWHGAEVGSLAGAVPPVVGYAACAGRLYTAALLLFLTLIFWQMPHFYAIAIYRQKDYQAAGVPVLPIQKSHFNAKLQITAYIVAFTITAALISVFGYAGLTYRVVILAAGIYWLQLAIRGFKTGDDERWARQVFGASLIITIVLSVMLAVGPVLP